jgi:5-methylcytosine-specific restriction endonuclease McrA
MDAATRRRVRKRAGRRCEYCRIHEIDEPFAFHLEHIISKKHGGKDNLSNLAWSCHNCNLGKGANLSGRVRGEIVALFHPRRQNWKRHFRWNGAVLIGKTKCGRATIRVLNINAEDRVKLRDILRASGAFPPD